MKVYINIDMTDDKFTIQSLQKETGMTKEEISDTYNKGIAMILQKFGDVVANNDIRVETALFDDVQLDVTNHLMKRSDFLKLKSAINIINDMVAEPSGGQTIDGIDYVDLFTLESKQLCLDAVNLIREFIIKYCVNINDMEECD